MPGENQSIFHHKISIDNTKGMLQRDVLLDGRGQWSQAAASWKFRRGVNADESTGVLLSEDVITGVGRDESRTTRSCKAARDADVDEQTNIELSI